MPRNDHRSRYRRATARLSKWWQCFVTSLQISDISDSESEHDPQPWPPVPTSPPDYDDIPPLNPVPLSTLDLFAIPRPPPPPPFPLESLRGQNHVRNVNSSPPFRAPPPRRPPPPPFEHLFPRNPFPLAEQRLDEDTTVSSAVLKVKISEACESDNPHCPICKEEYKVGEEAAKLRCFHAFHSVCVLQWLDNHRTCPVCRREMKMLLSNEWENDILEVGVATEVPQPPITLLEEEIEENNNENVNWDEAEIRDTEETHEVDGDSNGTSDSEEAGYESARDELEETMVDD